MASRFQAASLVASPSHPNAVAWSNENLVAVASSHLVTILNPAMPFGPRGLITIPASKPFSIGLVERKDFLSGCLLPTRLSRDIRPYARSISWSPIGFAPNSGCLLAVCTSEGLVKLYRMPYCEFCAEWVEVLDISEMLCNYLSSISFGELEIPSSYDEQASQQSMECPDDMPISVFRRKSKRRRQSLAITNKESGTFGDQSLRSGNIKNANPSSTPYTGNLITLFKDEKFFPCSILQEGSSVEVFEQNEQRRLWVSGTLDHFNGAKALIKFSEADGSGKQDEWIEMDSKYDYICAPCFPDDTVAGQEIHFPRIRPCMNVGNLPEQILFHNCQGVEDVLRAGQALEACTNDRWVEGVFVGLNENGLLVKFYGDTGSVTLDASSVRLAPSWISEQKSWQVTLIKIETKGQELHKAVQSKSDDLIENNPHQIVCAPNSKGKPLKKIQEKCTDQLITADRYASRSAMMSSLLVAWSPILRLTTEIGPVSPDNSPKGCALLAVGGKSGKISFWRIHEPQCYSVVSSRDPTSALLVGLLQAHSTWITSVSWELFVSDASNLQILLATGSSDGSVKIWQGHGRELLKSSEVSHAPFSLLKEVIAVNSVSVSVLSLKMPVGSPHKIYLAVGKGSGSFEVWICDISTGIYDRIISYEAHDHIVTGIAWAFDGHCLYSCSQDNSVRCWILHGNSLSEVPIPSNISGVKSSTDVPNVFDSCFGVAVSPGNLVLAVARSFDADLLNPMYQARTQKAAVEFFWIGGQQLDAAYNRDPEFDVEAFPGFLEKDLNCWECNILWSLNQFEQLDKPLVVWDVVAALLAFKQSSPKYVEHVIAKWLISFVGFQLGLSTAKFLPHVSRSLSKITSRQLHLLNIISRHVILGELKGDTNNKKQKNCEGLCGAEEELTSWMELLLSSERELRERLVGFSFSVVLSLISNSRTNFGKFGYWHPVGLAQMEQWVALNHYYLHDDLKLLTSEVGKLDKSILHSTFEYVAEEQCSYCSASIPFESVEAGFCRGVKCDGGVSQSHKLARCSVSMQVCPTNPLWFCSSCQRWASKLAPWTLFTMRKRPSDIKSSIESSTLEVSAKPLCPFCGILLQRLQPEFLLSPSPV
ncbi:uncharacterized protein LOC132271549 isoform X2 [Cornus florida]|uniref:uncharacterized protein LOC132271549 isoform X2 n=1 Tax=Cornus florida TaxID=4283 RepID=UPI00289EBF0C|nr:uncharacterized protein LOC132271549 isoform X2 [Cornus florida]